MPLECALCGYKNDVEIVSHIRKEHGGGLKAYMVIFPDLAVVNSELFTAIENQVFFQYQDDTPGLDAITAEEKEFLIVSARNNATTRSEITVEPDF